MTGKVKLTKFTDIDRMLSQSNILVTIIGSALAFVFSYLSVTFLPLPFAPFGFSLTFSIVIASIAYCRNLGSTVVVTLAGAIGLISVNGDPLFFVLGYIQFLLIFGLILGFVSNQLKLILSWTRFYLIIGFIMSYVFVVMSLLSNSYASRYWKAGIPIGIGGDPYLDTGYPLLEAIVILLLLIVFLVSVFFLKGHISLEDKTAQIYRIFGIIFIAIAYLSTFVCLYLYTDQLNMSDIAVIANSPHHIRTLDNLFTHQSNGAYAVFVSPINGFLLVSLASMFLTVGGSLLLVGMRKGNLEGVNGGFYTIFQIPSVATLLFFTIGSWYLQTAFSTDAFFIGAELFPVYLTILWAHFLLSSLVAMVFYGIFYATLKRE